MRIEKKHLFGLLFLLGTTVGFAQTTDNLLENPSRKNAVKIKFKKIKNKKNKKKEARILTYKSDSVSKKSTAMAKTVTPVSSGTAGSTVGVYAVSLTGAATYSIPFSLPPGIKGLVPNVGLSFSSQAGNGLAGWGWNVSGLSTISRIPSTKFHDDIIDPVDFDALDRFSIDGQRLILKKGIYGVSGSEYETENYSNLKIIGYGSSPYGSSYGPSYFIVYYPDGSRAWYGNSTDSNGLLEWSLTRKKDAQGNYIAYAYEKNDNLLKIKSISYGANGSSEAPNRIQFIYKNRNRAEVSYINGQVFKRSKILDYIEIYGGSQLYRKYKISHEALDPNSLGYQKIETVTETNEANESFAPIQFTYETTASSTLNKFTDSDKLFPRFNYNSDVLFGGEFNGDGSTDIVTYNKTSPNKLNVFMDLFDGLSIAYEVNTSVDFETAFSSKILSWNGKILGQQGITTVTNLTESSTRFRTFAMNSYGPIFQYDKVWENAPTFSNRTPPNEEIRRIRIPMEYVTGDFNGDGLTDVMALGKPYTYVYECGPVSPREGGGFRCSSRVNIYKEAFFIDLKRDAVIVGSSSGNLQQEIKSTDKVLTGDFNGDGKTDIFHFTEGKVLVYTLDQNSNLQLLHTEVDSNIKMSYPILLGDYNGDGKTDFMIPTAHDSSYWRSYTSKGNSMLVNHKWANINYKDNYSLSGTHNSGGVNITNPLYEFNFIAQDFNGDGKTDILRHHIATSEDDTDTHEKIQLFSNIGVYNGYSFSQDFYQTYNGTGVTKYGKPFVLEARLNNCNSEYVFLNGNDIYGYELTRSHSQEMTLKKIQNNEIVTDILYKKMDSEMDHETYMPDYSENYPYANINTIPSLQLVKEVTQRGSGVSQTQKYQYGGAVSHAQGLGFLGFKTVKKTNWYGNGVGQLWNVSLHNPQMRGAVTLEWVSTSASSSPRTYLNKTDYSYDFSLKANPSSSANPYPVEAEHVERNAALHTSEDDVANKSITLQPGFHFTASNTATYTGTIVSEEAQHTGNPGAAGYAGVFSGLPISVTKEDALQGVTTTQTIGYDLYNNPLSTTTSFPGGSKTKTYAYSHNASATDNTYHIGRPTKITESNILGSESFSSEQEMTYGNNLISTLKKKGNGTDWVTETFGYDAFGNVLTKTLSATGISSRTESFQYDASGRFLTQSTDIEGLETRYTYNYDNGNPLTVTNPYGLTTTYVYDGWGRVLTETNYLGKSNNYAYHTTTVDGDWSLAKTTDSADGGQVSAYYNAFGWLVQSKALSLNDTYVYKSYEHDAIGRTIGESEPYFENDTKQWNTFAFDDAGRPVSQSLYTGRVIHTRYSDLSVTVDDGTTTRSSTKNAVGNIVQMTDPGGTINYTYHANGSMKQANYGSHVVSTEIDGWGRKTKLNDPSAGEHTYSYNILGEILTETTPKGTTSYSYDNKGKLIAKTINGDLTDLSLSYAYDPSSKLLTRTSGTDGMANKNYTYTYTYDGYKRPITLEEVTSTATFEKQLTYDAFGRIARQTYSTEHIASTTNSTIATQHVFDAAGILTEIKDAITSVSLWNITAENARGQATNIVLGNGISKVKTYDSYGFLTNISDTKTGVDALKMDYSFDTQRGNLTSRKNYGFSNWTENFTYDSQDRLTAISGAVNHSQRYDTKGRIEENSFVGEYNYHGSKQYQLAGIDLNTQGDLYYQNHAPQQISYNAFKKPVSIYEEGEGRVDFEYGPLQNRTHAYYGGLQADKTQRQYHKQYSSILPVEMVNDQENNTVKIITYIGGDGYTAPIAHIKQSGDATDDYYYLHRDYLGSILAITDSSGAVKEQRQFGAWGQADQFVDSDGKTIFNYGSLIGRGYTGHEHFFDVHLIHMNGRMYDANLGRFLSPDNFIQDPFNTQSYNRYGYVVNNPLINVDYSGESFWRSIGKFLKKVANIVAGIVVIPLAIALNTIATVISYGHGLYQGIFENNWTPLHNANKIFLGKFQGSFKQILSRFTWESAQSNLGSAWLQWQNVLGNVDRVDYFDGATFATNEYGDGPSVSLGSYIFINNSGKVEGNFRDYVLSNPLYMHEYGHYIDSQHLGLSYLTQIGIPSARSAKNSKHNHGTNLSTHDTFWAETRANRLAAQYFSRYGVDWIKDFEDEYPLN
jgi:RHS repeat-associated protein